MTLNGYSATGTCINCGSRLRGKQTKFCRTSCQVAHWRQIRKELARTEWHSPAEIVEAARAVMGGIDLDPASCAQANEIVKAEKFYSVREDGLKRPWSGRIWLNPPYGQWAPLFIKRFNEFFNAGAVEQGVLLLATHHLTSKWTSLLFSHEIIICLPPDRLRFSDRTRPAHGSVILGVGVNRHQFTEIFSEFGHLFNAIDNPAFAGHSEVK